MTSSTLPPEAQQKSVKYWEKMGNLNLLMGALTAADHKKSLEEAQRNREAESAAVRKHVWGSSGSESLTSEEDMGDQIVLGDIRTENKYEAAAPSSSGNLAKTLAGVGLAAAGVGTGLALPIAAYQMLKPATNVVVPTDTDTNTEYGLQIFREAEKTQAE